ncbi:MAG: hypothetical protein M3313_15985 [Actinomycetota bacterium]|nr:hypothetical protein [Actinomycetota bacterium]
MTDDLDRPSSRWVDSPDDYRVMPEPVAPEQTVAHQAGGSAELAPDWSIGLVGEFDGGDGD